MTFYPTDIYMPSISPTTSPTDQKTDESKINMIVTIAYVSIQVSVAIIVSIMGAIHVRRCMNEEKIHNLDIDVNSAGEDKSTTAKQASEIELQIETVDVNSALKQEATADDDKKDDKKEDKKDDIDAPKTLKKQKGFYELWARMVWKMRGVYGGLAV
eukprot:23523_1